MLEKLVLSDAHIVCDSDLVARDLVAELSVNADRVSVVPLGVEAEFDKKCSSVSEVLEYFRLTRGCYFLVVGTIEPRKNILRICAAYRNFRERTGREVPLIFVGSSGWKSSAEHAEIEDLESRGWARYLRYVREDQLVALYKGATSLIFPSIYEGFGLPAAEAVACGCKVITSVHSPMAAVVTDSDFLVNPLEIDEIEAAMANVLDAPKQGHAAEESKFRNLRTWRDVAADTVLAYSAAR